MLRTFEFLNTSQTLPLVVNTPSSSQASSRITATCDCPNQCRTLWDIVWSCLFTMFLCTWVSIHPNIPSPHEGWVRVTSRRLGVMLAVLIAPELIFSWALRQRILARRLANEHRAHGWTVTHGFFAIMGGFMAFDGDRAIRTLIPDELEEYSLTGKGDFPRITEEEINDKSKSDAISKGLAILQTGWFLLQCIARKKQGLPIAELEVITIAFAVVSITLFAMWWDKPFDVERAVRVYKKPSIDEPGGDDHAVEDENLNLEPAGNMWSRLCHSLKALFTIPAKILKYLVATARKPVLQVILVPVTLLVRIATGDPNIVEDKTRIATFYPETWALNSEKTIVLSSTAVTAVFGSIHCIAWYFAFPSNVEQLLWRLASVVITALPIAFVPLVGLYVQRPTKTFAAVLVFCLPIYIICRMILLLLPLLSLRSLSPDTYQSVDWVTVIPHL